MTESTKKHVKQMPGRQRPGTSNSTRPPTRKNYASENDAARSDLNFRPDFTTQGHDRHGNGHGGGSDSYGPTTPQKTHTHRGQKDTRGTPLTGSRRKNNASSAGISSIGKPYSRSNPSSPVPASTDKFSGGRGTPSHSAGLKSTGPASSTSATTAFAGATFHASPAPSALPIPSFYTKKSPSTLRADVRSSDDHGQQPSPPTLVSELRSATGTEHAQQVASLANVSGEVVAARPDSPSQKETPLSVFFNAARAEKERNRRSSSAIIDTPNMDTSSPSACRMHTVSDNTDCIKFPREYYEQNSQNHPLAEHQKRLEQLSLSPEQQRSPMQALGVSAAKSDGDPRQLIGPAFSTPYQDRINAVRLKSSAPSSITVASGSPTSEGRLGFYEDPNGLFGRKDASSEALMRLLRPNDTAAPTLSSSAGLNRVKPLHSPPANTHTGDTERLYHQSSAATAFPPPTQSSYPIHYTESTAVTSYRPPGSFPTYAYNGTNSKISQNYPTEPLFDDVVRDMIKRGTLHGPRGA